LCSSCPVSTDMFDRVLLTDQRFARRLLAEARKLTASGQISRCSRALQASECASCSISTQHCCMSQWLEFGTYPFYVNHKTIAHLLDGVSACDGGTPALIV
jgi:hypothetical protein